MAIDPDVKEELDSRDEIIAQLTARVVELESRISVPAISTSWIQASAFRDRATEVGNDQTAVIDRIMAEVNVRKDRQAPVRIDLEGSSLRTAKPLEFTTNVKMIDGNINLIASESLDGGSSDSRKTSQQKGVIRMLAHSCQFSGIGLFCNHRAAGFEDGPVDASGQKSRGHLIEYCRVLDFGDYAFRYASQTGGGYALNHSMARKFRSIGEPRAFDADLNTGHGFIMDSNDGTTSHLTVYGGERPIIQLRGGTITMEATHPWQPPSYYTRNVSGAAGTQINMGHTIRALNEITFDASKIAVSRDWAWNLIVTLKVDVPTETPERIVYRRDPVGVELKGWGSSWIAPYFDGGSVRVWGHSPCFTGVIFLPGGGEGPDGVVPTLYELVPTARNQKFDLASFEAPIHSKLLRRAIAIPNPTRPNVSVGHSAEELAAFRAAPPLL